MNGHLRTLKQLIDAGTYPIDERAVAEAIIARAQLAGSSLSGELAAVPVRSFRRDSHAASFRLVRRTRLQHG